ncbi:unnamed protein product, partial [marine sediment metagenome]
SSYKGLPKETILLADVQTIQGQHVTDHLWFNNTKGFKALGTLYPGDIVAFDARVRPYVKGYVGRDEDKREIDYKLSHPTKLVILGKAACRKIYNICEKCGYANEGSSDRCRRCGSPFEEQLEVPKVIEPKLKQRTLEEEFRSIMESIGVISKKRKH